MTDTTSNPQSGFDWQDACLDPHHHSLQQGKAEGRDAGSLAGFKDGLALGQNKGLEFGLEIGFYQGVLEALRQKDWSDRILKTIDKVQEAMDDFPSVDQVFAPSNSSSSSTSTTTNHATEMSSLVRSSNLDNMDQNDSEDVIKLDILNKLQRIRARFKLLTVQLGKPQFSLRNSLQPQSVESSEIVDAGW